MTRTIALIKIGKLDQSILKKLKISLEQRFEKYDFSFEELQNEIELNNSEYDSDLEQYCASKILNRITSFFRELKYFRLIGVMNKDIYDLGYNFIFGIADKSSGVGIISIARLSENFYKKKGLAYRKKETQVDIELRILKEVIHELGHTFGLKHCNNYCIMKFSNSLNDTDKKPESFCKKCSRKLKRYLKNIK